MRLNNRIALPEKAALQPLAVQRLEWFVTPQEEFDAKYISSTEICRSLDVTRASVLNARNRGMLPEPVQVKRANGDPHIMLWLRAEATPYIERWRVELEVGRAA